MAMQLLTDDIWNRIAPCLPKRPPRAKRGRPALSDRDALAGILFVLRTGIAWEDLPIELGYGCGTTCLRRLREWQRSGVWREMQMILTRQLREARRIDWSRSCRECWLHLKTSKHSKYAAKHPQADHRSSISHCPPGATEDQYDGDAREDAESGGERSCIAEAG
jgi:transposase